MKKVMMTAALAAALVACQSKGNQTTNDALAVGEGVMAVVAGDSSAVAVYEGVLPAADGQGVQYVLGIDSVGPGGEYCYTLVTTYLNTDGTGKNKSFTTRGHRQMLHKTVNNRKKTALKLTPDDGSAPLYFVVVNDTTLRLVNDSLQETVGSMNYDITQVK